MQPLLSRQQFRGDLVVTKILTPLLHPSTLGSEPGSAQSLANDGGDRAHVKIPLK